MRARENFQVGIMTEYHRMRSSLKGADTSFKHVSNSYFLKDECCHCLTSDATIIVSYKDPIIGKQVAVIFIFI